jgi:hypothetical protein
MPNSDPAILQIVPKVSDDLDGVGDYARTLAKRFESDHGIKTMFAAGNEMPVSKSERVILHYVNYGYQRRGVPFRLLSILRKMRHDTRGRLVTIFHELYASGPPWRSAFWLRPLQIHVAREIARLSDAGIVSDESSLQELHRLCSNLSVFAQPIFSAFGEPDLLPAQIAERDPHRWVICGGTGLVERSLRSFSRAAQIVPGECSPRELFVLGGKDNPAARSLIVDLAPIRVEYRPQIGADEASQILSTCAFAWLDYFHRPDVRSDAILKSSSFAALCAHGVVAVFPHAGTTISLEGDSLPGPFSVSQLPANPASTRSTIYSWYGRHASSKKCADQILRALGLIK